LVFAASIIDSVRVPKLRIAQQLTAIAHG